MAKLLFISPHTLKALLLFITISTTTTTILALKHPHDHKLRHRGGGGGGHGRPEKFTHLHFFWHDILTGRDPTAVSVARAASTNASATFFGVVNVIDDPLTAGPAMASKLVGRAQGLYASASKEGVALMMAMNFAFTEGEYNGSTVAVLGQNAAFSDVREMAVVGGSGAFRLARGYVQARTHSLDVKTGNAVVEYDVFVWHH
ncbi:dirigent protein 22-like [Ananas comosus]|uniref:Dirigent protein n=1 Tax=Ananas comosus TaxID=4615 RepID=A0A6P5EZB7_ANACO|nr:dirigent protein 22-like [Ananas comosus]